MNYVTLQQGGEKKEIDLITVQECAELNMINLCLVCEHLFIYHEHEFFWFF